MKRLVGSFFITLLIYLLFFSILFINRWPKEPVSKKRVRSLDLAQIRIKKPSLATPPLTKPEAKPLSKLKPKKAQRIKPKAPKTVAKKELNTTKKISKPKRLTKKSFKKKSRYIAQKKRVHRPKPPPSLAKLFASKRPKESKPIDLPKEYRKLYMDEYDSFSKAQKEFLKNNLAKIGYITQKYLYLRGYPYISVKTRQQGSNAVEFLLHPNGDITHLRLIRSSGFEALDKNSIETIKTAYKDYPLPTQTTKIRIEVKYELIY